MWRAWCVYEDAFVGAATCGRKGRASDPPCPEYPAQGQEREIVEELLALQTEPPAMLAKAKERILALFAWNPLLDDVVYEISVDGGWGVGGG